jgi:tetratricopeptide (TPR) repeat protein
MALMVACSSREALRSVERAEQLLEEAPEEALRVMEGVDGEALRTEEDRARYALVYSEACYYSYIDVDVDTLTQSMMRYYLESDDHNQRARAMFQHAVVAYNGGELAEAIVALTEAEESLAKRANRKLEGAVQRLKGNIYSEGCLYLNAYDAYVAAREIYAELGLEEHVQFLDYDIGGTLIQLRRMEEAKVTLERVLDYAIGVEDANLVCAVAHELLDLSIYLDDYDMCREYVELFEREGVLLYGEPHFVCAKAMLVAHDGGLEEALALVDEAEAMEDDLEWADVEYARYIIHRNVGDGEGALYWQEQSVNAQDEMLLQVIEQPVLNVEVEKLRSDLDAELRERELVRERNAMIYVVVAVVVVAVVVALSLYARYRIRRKDSEIASYIETIESLRTDIERIPRDMASSITALYRDRFSELNELCDIYYDHSGSSRHKSLVFNKVLETIETIKGDSSRIDELGAMVDNYRDNALQRLKSVLPRISERDYRVALYAFAGFSNRAIALFIDSDPVAVSKIKYNIKSKLKGVEAADCEQLIALLSDK